MSSSTHGRDGGQRWHVAAGSVGVVDRVDRWQPPDDWRVDGQPEIVTFVRLRRVRPAPRRAISPPKVVAAVCTLGISGLFIGVRRRPGADPRLVEP